MPSKLTYDDICQRVKLMGYILVSEEYINSSTELILKDVEGYFYGVKVPQLQQGVILAKFATHNSFTIQNLKHWTIVNNKNFSLVSDIYENNNTNLLWKCFKPDCGEIFKMTWANISRGQDCACCHGMQVGLSNCLATKNSELSQEWHPTKNESLTPYDVTCNSGKKVWWICDKGHEWETTVANRNKGKGCPFCAGQKVCLDNCLANTNLRLTQEWHPIKNGTLTPYCITGGSNKYIWWKCENGHEWRDTLNHRSSGRNCPYCEGRFPTDENNLFVVNPTLCEEWNYIKNFKNPSEYCPNSSKRVWWKCKCCTYEWEATITNRNRGRGCPQCNKSKGEARIDTYLDIKGIVNIPQKEFPNLLGIGGGNLSYDFYLPHYNLLIEYQGEFHDGNGGYYINKNLERQQEHDQRKKEYANNQNINLLEIWYYDFDNIEIILDGVFGSDVGR